MVTAIAILNRFFDRVKLVMDPTIQHLLGLRKQLLRSVADFCDFSEANETAIPMESLIAIRDLIEITIDTIEETPIAS
jgi:hypothetical protein